ncbi:MAG TPA: Hsp70 family protein [Pirellulales bacterium]|nr:Hsp70 family protein [Pirellulales bacterium]
MSAKFAVGIDLGTTNSALAYCPLDAEAPRVELLNIPQLVAPATIEERPLLPSFLYLGTDADAKAKNFDLPWEKKREYALGELARRQSAEVPTRTVAAAKSWLCHSRVDRHQPILPWNAPADVPKISPVTASTRYLAHLAAAWQAAFKNAPLSEQQVVLTVPASFDPAARELTREAAIAAGLPENLVLLEEPQAAVYAWLADQGDGWRKQVSVGDRLLVCDVGGGTTDFTLVGVSQESGDLMLERLAVGNHILVGGDNMDLALAHFVAGAFGQKGVQLDPWQSVALWHSCRNAKETLLDANGPKKHPVTVLGRGSKLIKGTVSVDVEREAAGQLLVEGFFPQCQLGDEPARQRASGFRELGLPFESDTAITRHLAAFLRSQGEGGEAVRPTRVLFNGGVFKSALLRERLFNVLASWFAGPPQPMAGNQDLDFAVARGAAYYGYAKQRKAVRIRGGTARSYYVGIETAGPAIPGAGRPLRALCVVPFGMEEGTENDVPSGEIGLVVGEPAQFRFFNSAVRKEDRPGALLHAWTEAELAETDPLVATLAKGEGIEDYVPVRFQSKITELGMFELWCQSTISPHRWKLEFSVREEV